MPKRTNVAKKVAMSEFHYKQQAIIKKLCLQKSKSYMMNLHKIEKRKQKIET